MDSEHVSNTDNSPYKANDGFDYQDDIDNDFDNDIEN